MQPCRESHSDPSMEVNVLREKLKAAEERLAILGDIARFPAENPNPVMRIGEDGILRYANPASQEALAAWGWEVGRPVGASWLQIAGECLRYGRNEIVERQVGSRVLSFQAVPVLESAYVNLYGRDITDAKQAEKAIHHRLMALTRPLDDVETLRFEDLFDVEEIQKIQDAFAHATGVASLITDLHGQPITQPSNFCRLCQKIIRGTPKGLANCMCSDAELGKMNAEGPTVRPCLSGGLWDGGTSICVGDRHIANWLIGQVLDESQDPERMLAYGREIGADMNEYREALGEVTRMPRAQFEKICQALHLIARQLSLLALQNVQQARAITERQNAERALIEADRRKDEFLAMLAHELRNPLAPIRNAVQILRLAGGGSPILERQREIIDRQVGHMARLLDDLLDVSRITRGKIHLKKERLDLCEVVDHAIESIRAAMESRSQVLIHSRPARELPVEGDPTRLEQVMSNLLNNAVKYSENGKKIWVEVSTPEASGEATPEVAIAVRDEGVGIAPEMLPKVFEIFAQASQSLDRSQGGLGLGLTLVQQLVTMHGGTVRAASAGLGHGSTFTLRLPLMDQAPPSGGTRRERNDAPRHGSNSAAGGRWKVLVVDDIADTAASMAEVLELWNCQVEVAHDGPHALERARIFRPQAVLLDIGLPGMDGYEVARRLRRDVGLHDTLIIALTGYGSEEDRRRANGAGFDYHFAKPVDFTLLQNALATGLQELI